MPDKKFRGVSNLPVAIPDVPDAPTVSASNVGTSRAFNNGAATVTLASPTGGRPASYSITTTPTTVTTTATSSPVTLTGLASATSYTVTATPTNVSATGPGGTSSSFTATTVPQAPTIGTFTDGGTGTTGTLSFTAGATGGSAITGYKYSTNGTTYTSASGTTSPLSLTGLTPGTYTFTLQATNANGDSAASSGVSGTVVTPNSFESIATASGTGSSGVITFSNIPSTYTALQFRILGRTTSEQTNTDLYVRYNSSTSGYASHNVQGNGSIVETKSDINETNIFIYQSMTGNAVSSNIMGVAIVDIHDYVNTSRNKTLRVFSGRETNLGASQSAVWLSSGFLNNTAAVSSVTFTLGAGNWTTNSIISLYGIKGA